MKFCKNLQRVVDISDPEWAPYWTNYKMLKKLIKELPSLVPADDFRQRARSESQERARAGSPSSIESSVTDEPSVARHQQHGDKTTEVIKKPATQSLPPCETVEPVDTRKADEINKSPGEVAFFKLLHAEFKKSTHFFDKAQQEFTIREERVREGMEIMKRPNSIMVNEKWSLLAKSLYRLYKDLLLLETFAIMTYCSFSKILKKHDKVTGYDTRVAFMTNVVNNANFSTYPVLLEMIKRCELMYEEVSQHLVTEGKEGLYEDERLFINMIHRLNEQCMDTADAEGVPERNDFVRPSVSTDREAQSSSSAQGKLSSLQLIVDDMGKAKAAGQVSDSPAESYFAARKRPADGMKPAKEKKQKPEPTE